LAKVLDRECLEKREKITRQTPTGFVGGRKGTHKKPANFQAEERGDAFVKGGGDENMAEREFRRISTVWGRLPRSAIRGKSLGRKWHATKETGTVTGVGKKRTASSMRKGTHNRYKRRKDHSLTERGTEGGEGSGGSGGGKKSPSKTFDGLPNIQKWGGSKEEAGRRRIENQ